MVLFGGCAWLYFGGVCMVLFGGCAWFYLGACMVLFGGHVWFYSRGHAWFFWGGVCGFFSFFGYNEIRSMSGRYASYLECILVVHFFLVKYNIFIFIYKCIFP